MSCVMRLRDLRSGAFELKMSVLREKELLRVRNHTRKSAKMFAGSTEGSEDNR